MPTFTQLQYILAVNKTKHFGRAAKECHVSQPSLSAQIQKVEEELDTIIFDRSKKPIITTDKGKEIINQAQAIVREHQKLIDISLTGEEIAGDFHLGVIPTLSPYLVPLFVENFSKKYPKVKLKISEYKTSEIVNRLYEDELDGGLLVTPLGDDKIIERSLFLEPFYAFVAEQHPYYSKSKLQADNLDESEVWLLDEGHCFRNQMLHVCSSNKSQQVLNNVSFQSGSFETLTNLIRKGRGYTLLPYLATQNLSKEEKEHNLKPLTTPVPTREISLVHSRSFLKEDIIQALVDEISDSTPPELKNLKRSNVQVVDL